MPERPAGSPTSFTRSAALARSRHSGGRLCRRRLGHSARPAAARPPHLRLTGRRSGHARSGAAHLAGRPVTPEPGAQCAGGPRKHRCCRLARRRRPGQTARLAAMGTPSCQRPPASAQRACFAGCTSSTRAGSTGTSCCAKSGASWHHARLPKLVLREEQGRPRGDVLARDFRRPARRPAPRRRLLVRFVTRHAGPPALHQPHPVGLQSIGSRSSTGCCKSLR
jgi:hypothetical protein